MKLTEIQIGSRIYDLAAAFPLTLGDWEKLNEMKVMRGEELDITTPTQVIDLIHYMVRKANPAAERAEIMSIPLKDMNRVTKALAAVWEADKTSLDDPTSEASSTSSTSSDKTTDGT